MKRIQWLDFAKGLTIFIVLVIHVFNYANYLEYILDLFAMPVFFAISGYLYKPTNTWHKYKIMLYKKSTSLLLPYIFFTILYMICTKQYNFALAINHIFLFPITWLWFLYTLFIIFIIVGTFDLLHINNKIQLIVYFMLMCIQMCFPIKMIQQADCNLFIGVFGYILSFYIGYIFKRYNLINILKLKTCLIILSSLWIVFTLFDVYLFNIRNNVMNNPDLFNYCDTIPKLLSIPLLFSIFVNFNHNKLFKYFDEYGKYTLIIYLVHVPIILIIFKCLAHFSIPVNLYIRLIMIIIVWYMCIWIYKLSKEIKIIDFIFYPRKYINKMRG